MYHGHTGRCCSYFAIICILYIVEHKHIQTRMLMKWSEWFLQTDVSVTSTNCKFGKTSPCYQSRDRDPKFCFIANVRVLLWTVQQLDKFHWGFLILSLIFFIVLLFCLFFHTILSVRHVRWRFSPSLHDTHKDQMQEVLRLPPEIAWCEWTRCSPDAGSDQIPYFVL